MHDLMNPHFAPPSVPEHGGEEERWVIAYTFMGQISNEAIDAVLQLDRPAAHVIAYDIDPTEGRIILRSSGMMDYVVADATETIRPFIGNIITNELTCVVLISHEDAYKALEQNKSVVGFDITKTVKAYLGLS